MGDVLSRIGLVKPDPCGDLFQAYLRCAHTHQGVHPEVYGEYCEEEKEVYLDCRRKQSEIAENQVE